MTNYEIYFGLWMLDSGNVEPIMRITLRQLPDFMVFVLSSA